MRSSTLVSYMRQVVSHELRSPLASIKAITFLLGRTSVTSEQKGHLAKIDQKVDLVSDRIAQLLDYLKIEEGTFSINTEPVVLNKLLTEVVESEMFTENSRRITMQFESEVKAPVDPALLKQVFRVLLQNAVSFSPQSKEVIVSLKKEKSTVAVQVQDFGVGMNKAQLDTLFDKSILTRSRDTTQGLGLNLLIAHAIVTKHKGSLTVQSTLKKGSTFTITLPFK